MTHKHSASSAPSPGGATVSSPGRKPWDSANEASSPEGRRREGFLPRKMSDLRGLRRRPQRPGFRGETELCSRARLASRFRVPEFHVSPDPMPPGSWNKWKSHTSTADFPSSRIPESSGPVGLGTRELMWPTDVQRSRFQGHCALWNLEVWNSWTLMGYAC
jgi:hypothetical protein